MQEGIRAGNLVRRWPGTRLRAVRSTSTFGGTRGSLPSPDATPALGPLQGFTRGVHSTDVQRMWGLLGGGSEEARWVGLHDGPEPVRDRGAEMRRGSGRDKTLTR